MIVERLTAAHDVDTFSCGNEELDLWLRHAALTSDRAGTARVHVVLDGPTVVGYFAVLPRQVRRADIPPGIGRGAPDTIPSYLLARPAVAVDLHGTGQGAGLLVLAPEKILDAATIAGGRLIVVDAIDEPASAFYQHHGFKPTPADPARLVMKASTAAASLGLDWYQPALFSRPGGRVEADPRSGPSDKGFCRCRSQHGPKQKGTSEMDRRRGRKRLRVSGGGRGLVNHAGARL